MVVNAVAVELVLVLLVSGYVVGSGSWVCVYGSMVGDGGVVVRIRCDTDMQRFEDDRNLKYPPSRWLIVE